ncbi:MAG: hypothetical protein F4148_05190 [Caldilineaceae bacterium SB0675_bin_29]|uniref:DUF1795 domain-containing protein n=1 Tax=Caldilineaceae bacterium SB0675_bin_29 TaxID=2605266 RepID=A0A6B1FYZ4_9CHLR|nr:hypothetical protein [Caldilineaceae bacterium SB0675_bin_29]
MWAVHRLFLLASVCLAFVLAGCVPIQPESPFANGQSPASSAQGKSQAAVEPTATNTPDPTATAAPGPPPPPSTAEPDPPPPPGFATQQLSTSTEWRSYVDETRGLSIAYPPGWIFVDPTKKELTDFMEELGEKANSAEIRELLATSAQAVQQNDLFVGLGFQFITDSSRDTRFVNNINAIYFHTEGLFLQLIAQMIAAQLDSMDGFVVDSAEVVAGLRPEGAEVASVRYRSEGALFNQPDMEIIGWQVGVLSPEAERIVVLTFSIRSEDFAELEPLLTEIVQRVQWLE